MDKILPVIEMDKPAAEEEPLPQETNLPEIPNDKQLIDQIQEDLLNQISEGHCGGSDDEIIQVDERIIPDEDDVFGEPPAPRVKPIISDEPLSAEQEATGGAAEFQPKTGKRKYTRKAPMSEKQKLHLDKIRKISLEKRKEKKIQKELEKKRKEEEKEEQRINKAAEKLLAKQQKQELPSPRRAEPVVHSVKQPAGQTFTRQDMEEAMFSAISSYETIRKKNKEEKKKEELAAARQNQMRRTLEQAIKPQSAPDPWRQYF
tara:strand:- start:720 stop:1499 length:780 start_codon:yes stop_codon:yes gene_type:complete